MKTKQVILTQTGYRISGTATITARGGGTGTIGMNSAFIPLSQFNKTALLSCINDGRFGVESIDSAEVDICLVFGGNYDEYDRTILISGSPGYRQHLFCRGI